MFSSIPVIVATVVRVPPALPTLIFPEQLSNGAKPLAAVFVGLEEVVEITASLPTRFIVAVAIWLGATLRLREPTVTPVNIRNTLMSLRASSSEKVFRVVPTFRTLDDQEPMKADSRKGSKSAGASSTETSPATCLLP